MIELGQADFHLTFDRSQNRLRIEDFRLGDQTWIAAGSPIFAIYADGRRCDAANLALRDVRLDSDGVRHLVAYFEGDGFEVEHHVRSYDDSALTERWQVIRATREIAISRLDSFALNIPRDDYDLLHFTSDWGQEFEPVRAPLVETIILETHAGRSSKGQHPYFSLFRGDGRAAMQGVLTGSVAWSGNWVLRFEQDDARVCLSGGLHDWEFAKTLAAGETMESAHVMLALGATLDDTAQQFARVGRKHWYPHQRPLPVEWNHWWSYEDADINEGVFLSNMDEAAKMGIELCTLDAGWFGQRKKAAHWGQVRGDWDMINKDRFPNGIRILSDYAHANQMKFGLWCEIEGLGPKAALNETRPEFAAMRDGVPLGYVCLGNRAARGWTYQTIRRLIRDFACDWVKLDFNVDPGAGCNRTDHGHSADDGLYEHYVGYYSVLDRLRAEVPNVVLENCASGGLRIDLGILQHTDVTFLSDPDYPVHSLQVFWGATTMLAPDACLHWSFSEWRPGNFAERQNFNPRDPNLKPHQLDYYTRIAMLGALGFSQKLPDLPDWVRERLTCHIGVYKEQVRPFVMAADLYHLTDQPRRDGSGERWCAFQYSLPADDAHLLFVFRLPGAEAARAVQLANLQPDRTYRIIDMDGKQVAEMSGSELMERGIAFNDLPEEGSALLKLT